MNYTRPAIAAMKGYVPGIQPDPREKYIKLNSNENPYPPSPRVREVLARLSYEDLRLYPDPVSLEIREKLAALYGFKPGQIICGNGSDDILNILVRTFAQPGDAVGFYEPTFPLYKIISLIHDAKPLPIPLEEPYDAPPDPPGSAKVFFLANPNSPVGFAYPNPLLRKTARAVQGVFVIDEAYAEFASENALDLVREFENVIVVRTISKSYSLAGVRLGYAIGSEDLISQMFKVKDPFNVTRLTQAVVAAALEDQAYFKENISLIVGAREKTAAEAAALGYRIIPSQANFIFPRPPKKGRGIEFYRALFDHKVLTRYYDEPGLRDGVRMTIGTPQEMVQTLEVMKAILLRFQ